MIYVFLSSLERHCRAIIPLHSIWAAFGDNYITLKNDEIEDVIWNEFQNEKKVEIVFVNF